MKQHISFVCLLLLMSSVNPALEIPEEEELFLDVEASEAPIKNQSWWQSLKDNIHSKMLLARDVKNISKTYYNILWKEKKNAKFKSMDQLSFSQKAEITKDATKAFLSTIATQSKKSFPLIKEKITEHMQDNACSYAALTGVVFAGIIYKTKGKETALKIIAAESITAAVVWALRRWCMVSQSHIQTDEATFWLAQVDKDGTIKMLDESHYTTTHQLFPENKAQHVSS